MTNLLQEHLGGSVAWLASGVGPRIAFAPEDGTGGGAGGVADPAAGDPQAEDDDKGGDDKSALKGAGGLLGTRKTKEDEKPAGDDEKPDDKKPAADGRPAHVPEKFWDPKTKTVKHDDMAKAYASLEKAHGDLKRAKGLGADLPASAEEYFADGLELDKEVDRLAVEGPDDPGLKAWGKIAHKYGIGKEAAVGIAKEMFREMNASAPAPVDLEAERDALGSGADELIDGVFLWLESQEKGGKFGASDIDVAVSISHTADGIRFLNKMRSLSGEAPIPMGLPQGHRGMSADEWHAEYRTAVAAKDYKKQAELDDLSAAIFGSENSTGSPVGGIPNQRR